jgi:YegS/Rv2252/BmrU family lipid kinase
MEKTLLVYNQFAHKGKVKYSLKEIEQLFEKERIALDTVTPERSGHAMQLVEDAVKEGFTRIILSGGDGTVNETINGLVQAQKKGYGKASLGILQNGRGNDFAHAAGIPANLHEAVSIIKQDRRINLDVGYVNAGGSSRYFCNGAGLGFDSAINYHATKSKLNGFPSYISGLISAVFKDFRQNQAKISWEDGKLDMEVLVLVTMNGKREGGGFVLAPDYDLTSGKLIATIIGDGKPVQQLLPLVPRLLNGQIDHPDILRFKTSWLKAEFTGTGLHGQADGEILCTSGNQFYAEICPEKIELICNQKVA